VSSVRVEEILLSVLDDSADAADAPARLVGACAAALPITGVGLVLMTNASPAGTVAISDARAGTMEDLQFTLGEGPCVECSRTGRPVLQPDLARTGPDRWPGFSAGALEAGIRAIFAWPLRVGGIRLGVLDLYRDRVGELSEAELIEALSFADAATEVLLRMQALSELDGSGVVSIPLVEDRAEVHQATGMITVQAGVGMAEALLRLRARAYASERPIVDVARDVLSGVLNFTEECDDDVKGR
jgi:GAF domain-containing protein